MAYNTKSLIVDAYNRIVAQYFNPKTDKYEAVEGADGATNVQVTGSKVTDQMIQPIAYPDGPLQYEIIPHSSEPRSIGADGYVYGIRAAGFPGKAIYSADGFKSVVESYDFSVEASPNTVMWATKTPKGWVVMTTDSTTHKGAVWFSSTSWTSGFTKVLDMPNGEPFLISVSRPIHKNDGILFVGEYVTGVYPSVSRNMYGSFDGGQTWRVIKTLPAPIDSNVNNHWHCAVYDEYMGRIWVSAGDGVNSYFGYSDDHGTTWNDVTIPAGDPLYDGIPFPQPTMLAAFPERIIMSPDRGSTPTGIWKMERDFEYKTVGSETFKIEHAHSAANWRTDQQYGKSAFVQRGDELYVTFPDSTSNAKKTYIAATGDGGLTWHNVLTFNLKEYSTPSMLQGIVGVDINGLMYAKIFMNGISYIMKITPTTWRRSASQGSSPANNFAKVFHVPSAATAFSTSNNLSVGSYSELIVDVNVSAITGTGPSYQLIIERLGLDGVYYPIYTGTAITAAGAQSISLGKGASTNVSLGSVIRVREVVAGTTPSITRSISIVGK